MRFAYIDSQGNEVPIPGVDALALRIELGAIGPETQLYDAAADRWGPAETHEIFRTLSRQMEEKGFVAPPPVPPAPPMAEETDVEESSAAERPGAGERPRESTEPGTPPAQNKGESPHAGGDEDEPRFDFSGGLEVEEVEVEEVPIPELEAEGRGESVERQEDILQGLDFTLTSGSGVAEPGGGEATGLVSEPEDGGRVDEEWPALGDRGDDTGPEDGGGQDEAWPEDGGMALEKPLGEEMDFSGAGDVSGGLDLESPMSEFTPDSPPAWMGDDASEEDGEDGLLGFSRPSAEGEEEDDEIVVPQPGSKAPAGPGPAPRERPQPRNRPSPPRRPRGRLPVGTILGVVILAALCVAGWQYGWPAFQTWRQAREDNAQAARPPVTLPDIPEDLIPRMQSLGRAALAGTISELTSEEGAFGLPAAPGREWLAGVYLANASRYPDIERYWVAVDSFVEHVRASDARIFHQQFVARLDSARIEGDAARILLARADSGFLATRTERVAAYDQMDDLVNAALDLHQFLVDNQDHISYEPAVSESSRDPVLEAVPSSKEIGDRMWGMVDRITGALDALGTLDQVTTKRLMDVLFERIRDAGFK